MRRVLLDTDIAGALRDRRRSDLPLRLTHPHLFDPFTLFGGAAGDPYFANVKLLMLFNGTDGSTTFTDSSASPATCSGLNGAALSTAQKKFGTASLLLNGTNQHVSTNLACGIGAGAFSMEAFVRTTAAQTGRVISNQNSGSVNAVATLRVDSTGSLTLVLRNSAGGGLIVLSSSAGAVAVDGSTWNYIAATRDGSGNITLGVDGVSVATGSSTTSPNGSGVGYAIGSQYASAEWFKGYIDSVRITEGVARNILFTPTSDWPTST